MKKLYFTLSMGLFVSLHSQTVLPSGLSGLTTENYVYSRTYLDSTATSSTGVQQIQSVTYYDGLGRPKQSVAVKATAKGNDLVSIIPYDGFGRQVKSYLPVSMVSKDGGIQALDSTGVVSYYTTSPNSTTKDFDLIDANPFSHKILESSPLDRIQQQIQPGAAWSTKPVAFEYETNISTEVYKFITSTTWSNNATLSVLKLAPATDTTSISNKYKDNQLYKNVVTDEDVNITTEFKNGEGQTILVRKNDGINDVDTYYVYNEYNQLAFVIPPKAVAVTLPALFPIKTNPADSTVLANLCYQYRYDGQGRLVEKRLPGKDWEYMVYDKQDRLVLTQDGKLRTTDNNFGARGWLFTKYDKFGRVVYTGFFPNGGSRSSMQGALNGMQVNAGNNEARTASPTVTLQGMPLYYDNKGFPTGTKILLSVNYYDTYPSDMPAVNTMEFTQTFLSDQLQNPVSTQSMPTASYVKNIENHQWTKAYSFYDGKGRTVGTYSINHLGGFTKTENFLDFVGVPQRTHTHHQRKSGDDVVQIKERFVYNANNNALEKHYHEVVGKSPEELLSDNTYNEIGQLKTKKVGNNIQEIEYTYNIRGWMTGLNLDSSGNFQAGKLFNYKINYNNTLEGLANPNLDFSTAIKPRYNGNIAEVLWQKDGDTHISRYGYVYDGLNRLLAGLYQSDLTATSKEHSERLTYDLNGNIITLKRSAFFMGTAADLIDNLEYDYTGNRLDAVHDNRGAIPNPSGYEGGGNTISYDVNGNMTDMIDKGITAILYNYLNLPKQVTINPDSNTTTLIKTIYRADGLKIRKENTTTMGGIIGDLTTVSATDYLDGFQYLKLTRLSEGGGSTDIRVEELETEVAMEQEAFSLELMAIAAPPVINANHSAVLQFVPTAEGFYDFTEDKYIYQYKDHLGNTRLSYAWNSTTTSIDVLDRNDYYPFGMNHLNLNARSYVGQGSYKNYKYNGKELQETGLYDYGARFYMPDIGRWGVVDPLAEKRPNFSPYVYCSDNPINRIDPDGRFDSKFGAFMHKVFHGHWGSKIQQNTNKESKMYGQYYYTYQSKEQGSNTDKVNYQNVNGEKVGNIAEVRLPTVVYNTAQERRTVAALRNTAEKLDYVAVAANVTAVALTPTTLGTGTIVAENVSFAASTSSTALNVYADFLEGRNKTAFARMFFYGVSFGISSKIQSWQSVVGKTSTTIMKGGNMLYDKTFDDAVQDYDRRTYPEKLKPEDY